MGSNWIPVVPDAPAPRSPDPWSSVGLALLVLPGPGLLLTAGLALLATEFAWAQRWLTRLREYAKRAV